MALRTNYKDDVYTGSRKYSMTTNPDTTVSFTDETTYTQTGDSYGAAQINEQNDHINNLDSHSFLDSATAETALADGDYIPFYDTSASAKRKVLLSKLKEFLLNALAPKVHDSNSAGTYGAATSSKFGHVKLSDSYTSSGGAASASVGASSQAVYDAYRNRAPINHASADTTYGRGNASQYGHVKVSDSYTSSAGSASNGMAASSKAVSDSYTTLNGRCNTLNDNIGSVNRYATDMISALTGELTANGKRIYMDYKNGQYGYNTSPTRGADTFSPFRSLPDSFDLMSAGAYDSHGLQLPLSFLNNYKFMKITQTSDLITISSGGYVSTAAYTVYNSDGTVKSSGTLTTDDLEISTLECEFSICIMANGNSNCVIRFHN